MKLAKPGMRLDLGGIAKGYAGDQAQKVLKEHGITQAKVDIGDIVISDPPPGKRGWTVEIPDAVGRTLLPKMQLSNCAISSSGNRSGFSLSGAFAIRMWSSRAPGAR